MIDRGLIYVAYQMATYNGSMSNLVSDEFICTAVERKVLNGDHSISLPNLAKLCKELDVNADYLLFGN